VAFSSHASVWGIGAPKHSSATTVTVPATADAGVPIPIHAAVTDDNANPAQDGTADLIDVSNAGATVATAPVVNGSTSFAPVLAPGIHQLVASYRGGKFLYPSVSESASVTVSRIATSIVAEPVILKLSPLGIPLPDLKARLTRTNSGVPVEG